MQALNNQGSVRMALLYPQLCALSRHHLPLWNVIQIPRFRIYFSPIRIHLSCHENVSDASPELEAPQQFEFGVLAILLNAF